MSDTQSTGICLVTNLTNELRKRPTKTETSSECSHFKTITPDPIEMVSETYRQLLKMSDPVKHLISLNLREESKENGDGPSDTLAGTEMQWRHDICRHMGLLQEPRSSVGDCEYDNGKLERECVSRMKHVERMRESYQALWLTDDQTYVMFNNSLSKKIRALQESDVKVEEAQEKYYQAEENFNAAVVNMCQTWITRLAASEHSTKEFVQYAMVRLEGTKSGFTSALNDSITRRESVIKCKLSRQQILESHDQSSQRIAALAVITPQSVAVTPVSVH